MAEQTVEEYLKAQEAEWSTYVATEVININGARAFNVGDPVPASHVTSGVVGESQVAKAQRDEPAGNASLEAWQEFARSKGATDADLVDVTRDQLRETYTTKES